MPLFCRKELEIPFKEEPIRPQSIKIFHSFYKCQVLFFVIIITQIMQLKEIKIGCKGCKGTLAPYTITNHIKYAEGIKKKNDFHP